MFINHNGGENNYGMGRNVDHLVVMVTETPSTFGQVVWREAKVMVERVMERG